MEMVLLDLDFEFYKFTSLIFLLHLTKLNFTGFVRVLDNLKSSLLLRLSRARMKPVKFNLVICKRQIKLVIKRY